MVYIISDKEARTWDNPIDINLREINPTDLEHMRNWRNSKEVNKYLINDTFITQEQQMKWYNKLNERKNAKYWILNCENKDIGYTTLEQIDKVHSNAQPAIFIGDMDYRGKGLGKMILNKLEDYAFNKLKLHKLYECIIPQNIASVRTYLGNDWIIEGNLKDQVCKDGKFYDLMLVAKFRK